MKSVIIVIKRVSRVRDGRFFVMILRRDRRRVKECCRMLPIHRSDPKKKNHIIYACERIRAINVGKKKERK